MKNEPTFVTPNPWQDSILHALRRTSSQLKLDVRRKRKFGLPQCNDSPNKTITRDVLSPNGSTVTGRQVEESTPWREHKAFHHIAPGSASVDELKVLMADNRQADKIKGKEQTAMPGIGAYFR